jgi:hypothetical protein
LANESLIKDIDWDYEPRGNDFYLTKTLLLGDRRIVASIDKDLRPEADTGVMIATPTSIPKPKAAEKVEGPKRVELSTDTKLALARENLLNALRRGAFNVAAVSLPDSDEERLLAAVMPKIIGESEASGLETELGRQYLVWKGKTGVLGFSNVQYPERERLSVYIYGRWFDVKMPTRKGKGQHIPETKKTDLETIAEKLKEGYLVWKDDRGNVGFGNVQYPAKHLAAVFETDAWLAVERQPVATDTVSAAVGTRDENKSLEAIASEIGDQYLVWKDKQGTVGFGNVQYPEKGLASVYQTAEWIRMTKPLVAQEKDVHESQRMATKKSSEAIASDFGRQFLVWKDKDGTLGFGNVQYPDQGLESVFDVGSWIEARKATLDEARSETKTETSDEGSTEKIAAAFSTRYLVWQDKSGTLGFGNVQYPENETISGVHVNGSWESVAN